MPNPGSPASGPVAGPGWWCRPSGPAVCFARPAVARGAWGTSPYCLLRYVCCLPRVPSFTAGHRTGVTRIASGVWPVRARIATNYAPDSAKSIRVLRIIRSLLPGCATKRTHLRHFSGRRKHRSRDAGSRRRQTLCAGNPIPASAAIIRSASTGPPKAICRAAMSKDSPSGAASGPSTFSTDALQPSQDMSGTDSLSMVHLWFAVPSWAWTTPGSSRPVPGFARRQRNRRGPLTFPPREAPYRSAEDCK